ncbi:hypothetical protein KDH_50560 [Dictyobacter sp. S3.2.2.5]|uniref:Uncharacterized protein n=1 Tax=Dictyobacter halimunensis TaxID=3026934 RepID=A0ABQ6FWM8_9CHLR|nr:hypothetical protein KDH_50560 [Dictyobacter sp. S3.2.2.5]
MLEVLEIEQLQTKVAREITSPAQGVVLINCQVVTDETKDEENEADLSVPLHWRAGDWSKPPIDIALDADTGQFQSLQLVLQDETIGRTTLLSAEMAASSEGRPIFARTAWRNDERYIDERLQPTQSWVEHGSLLVVFPLPPVQTTQICQVDDSLAFLLNEQNEVIGFRLDHITSEEKRTIRWAAPSRT